MADIKSPEERSKNMAKIRSRDTKPEEYIRKLLFSHGYRYRKNVNYVPGHPDAWLLKYHTAVFVNGCFWHRHKNCKYAYTPKSHVEFWTKKFQKNMERDAIVKQQLLNNGFRTLVIWECTVKNMIKSEVYRQDILNKIFSFLKSDMAFCEL